MHLILYKKLIKILIQRFFNFFSDFLYQKALSGVNMRALESRILHFASPRIAPFIFESSFERLLENGAAFVSIVSQDSGV